MRRPMQRAPLRWDCISRSPKARWRRGSRKKCGKNWISTLVQKRCMRLGCGSTRRSISTCSRPPIALCSTGWPPMSGGTDGPASLRTSWQDGATLDDYRHPDWAVTSGPGDYVHALVTRALPLEIDARIGPPMSQARRSVLAAGRLAMDRPARRRRAGQARRHHLCPFDRRP